MAIVLDSTDCKICKSNEKAITKLRTHIEQLQYAIHILKIEISVPLNDTLALFQLFFLNKQLNIIAANTNKNIKIGKLEAFRPA